MKLPVKHLLLLVSLHLGMMCHAQSDTAVINQLVRALTSDIPQIVSKDLITTAEWEALSYWDVNDPPVFDYLYEAVPDVYAFEGKVFKIKLVDPNNYRRFGTTIEGQWEWGNNALIIKPANGRPAQTWKVIYLSKEYLVLEIENLRIFFTHERSFIMENE